jgi:outer membrane protein assembly factor BamB
VYVTEDGRDSVVGGHREGTEVLAFRAADGRPLWRQTRRIAFLDAPLLARGGLVYLSTFHSPDDLREVFTALGAGDGTTRWETVTHSGLVPAVLGDVAYLGDDDGLQARRASSGELLWRVSSITWRNVAGYPPHERMMASGGTLYVLGEVENLYAVRIGDGKVLWERIQCVDAVDALAPEPHPNLEGRLVWCRWGTERVRNGLALPAAVAVGP